MSGKDLPKVTLATPANSYGTQGSLLPIYNLLLRIKLPRATSMIPILYLFKSLLSTHYVPGTLPSAKNTAGAKTDTNSCSCEVYIMMEGDRK